jgi:hypothetical protein
MPGTLALDCRYRSPIHSRCLKVQGLIPKEQWHSKISNDFNDLDLKNSHEHSPQGLSTGYPQPNLSPDLSTGYPQVVLPLVHRQWSLPRSPLRPHRSPRSEPNYSEHQRHKDSEPYSDIVSSESYSDSDVYVLYSIKVSYTLYSISRVPLCVYSIASPCVRDQFELQSLYCIVEHGQERGIPTIGSRANRGTNGILWCF